MNINQIILTVLLTLLTACGQKGPLYLPEEHVKAVAPEKAADPSDKPADTSIVEGE